MMKYVALCHYCIIEFVLLHALFRCANQSTESVYQAYTVGHKKCTVFIVHRVVLRSGLQLNTCYIKYIYHGLPSSVLKAERFFYFYWHETTLRRQ